MIRITKPPKKKECPCGTWFTPRGIQKYHSPGCEMKFKTGNIESTDLWKLDTSVLFQMAKGTFQAWIKKRDLGKPCISCECTFKKGDIIHAGHLYKCELYSWLIFEETNCNSQCDFCNCALDGNFTLYIDNLPKRIGNKKVTELVLSAHQKIYTKYGKPELIEIIEKYAA